MGYNAHKLFYQVGDRPCLKAGLLLSDQQRTKLLSCRKKIRAALRAGMATAGDRLPREEYYEGVFLETASSTFRPDRSLRPKFRTQGSWAYDTLNRPAKLDQQIDLDEGMYLPMSFVGNHAPAVASAALYRITEQILQDLCDKEGWEMDTSKSICIRLVIDHEAHVDLNIYAVPDSQLVLLEKAAEEQFGKSLNAAFDENAAVASQLLRLSPDQIYVAHRQKGWEQSDPLQLEDWFNEAVARHSEWTDLRRITRYLKAWRDHKWGTCSLSSLALMVCAVEALDEANTPPIKGRDDDGLLVVARALCRKLAGSIPNPVIPSLSLNDHWDQTEKNAFELMARGLRDEIENSIHHETSAEGVVARMRKAFGHRVPNDPTLVTAVGVIAQVRATEARQSPSPKVGSQTSGADGA